MERKINLLSTWLLSLSALAFMLLYVVLSFYNRVADEDLVFVQIVQSKGFFEFINWFYHSWSGRFSSIFCFALVMDATSIFEHRHYFLFLYHTIAFSILIYSANKIIRTGIHKIFQVTISLQTSLVYTILFVAGFYFSTFEHSQVWWWISASVDSLMGIVMLLLGISMLIKEKKTVLHYLFIIISFIYVGGGYEVYSFIVGALFTAGFIYLHFIKKLSFAELKSTVFFKGIALAFITYFISAIISYTAPGNFVRRMSFMADYIIPTGMFHNSSITLTPEIFLQKRYFVALAIASIWLLIGMKLRTKFADTQTAKTLNKIAFILFLLIIVSFCITFLFQLFVLVNYPIPLRGWTFTSFSIYCFASFLFLTFGYHLSLELIFLRKIIVIIIPLFILSANTVYLYREYNFTKAYSNEYDKLITILQETKMQKDTKVLYVNPMPDSGMLLPLELEKKWITDPLKQIFNLDYEIQVKQ